MVDYTDQFKSLVASYLDADIEFSALRAVTVAQWTAESGYGGSRLATDFLNFAGLKWRPEMTGFATPVDYAAHDGTEQYCRFESLQAFIRGYWHFLTRAPYAGWRAHTATGEEFIRFIGPIYTPTQLYADTVIGLIPKALALIASLGHAPVDGTNKPPGTAENPTKPVIKRFVRSPNQSSRNGERIRRIMSFFSSPR